MDIQVLEITKLVVGSAGFLGIVAAIIIMVFRTGKIVQEIEEMSKKFQSLDHKSLKVEERMNDRIKEMDDRFRKLEENIPIINIALTRLQVCLDERTIKVSEQPKKEIPLETQLR
jgi:hypothetical protein